MKSFLLIIVSVLVGSLGQVVLKLGANRLGSIALAGGTLLNDLWRMARTPEIILGFFLFTLSSLIWIKVLTGLELSYAYPMVSLGYVVVALFSYFLLGESFNACKIAGIALIISGIIVLNV